MTETVLALDGLQSANENSILYCPDCLGRNIATILDRSDPSFIACDEPSCCFMLTPEIDNQSNSEIPADFQDETNCPECLKRNVVRKVFRVEPFFIVCYDPLCNFMVTLENKNQGVMNCNKNSSVNRVDTDENLKTKYESETVNSNATFKQTTNASIIETLLYEKIVDNKENSIPSKQSICSNLKETNFPSVKDNGINIIEENEQSITKLKETGFTSVKANINNFVKKNMGNEDKSSKTELSLFNNKDPVFNHKKSNSSSIPLTQEIKINGNIDMKVDRISHQKSKICQNTSSVLSNEVIKSSALPQIDFNNSLIFNWLRLAPLNIHSKIISIILLHTNIFQNSRSSSFDDIKVEYAICNKFANLYKIDLIRAMSFNFLSKLSHLSRLISHKLPKNQPLDKKIIDTVDHYFSNYDQEHGFKCQYTTHSSCSSCKLDHSESKSDYMITISSDKTYLKICNNKISFRTICENCGMTCFNEILLTKIPKFLIIHFPDGLREKLYRYEKVLKGVSSKLSLVSVIELSSTDTDKSPFDFQERNLSHEQFLSIQSVIQRMRCSNYRVHFQDQYGWYNMSEMEPDFCFPTRSPMVNRSEHVKFLIYGEISDNSKYNKTFSLQNFIDDFQRKNQIDMALFRITDKDKVEYLKVIKIEDSKKTVNAVGTIANQVIPSNIKIDIPSTSSPAHLSTLNSRLDTVNENPLASNRATNNCKIDIATSSSSLAPSVSTLSECSFLSVIPYCHFNGNQLGLNDDQGILDSCTKAASNHSRSTASQCGNSTDGNSICDSQTQSPCSYSQDNFSSTDIRMDTLNSTLHHNCSSGVSSTSSQPIGLRSSRFPRSREPTYSWNSRTTASEIGSDSSSEKSLNSLNFFTAKRKWSIDDMIEMKRKKRTV